MGPYEALDRYEVAHGHMMEYLTSLHNEIPYEITSIPAEEFGDFIHISLTTLYGLLCYLSHTENISVTHQLQRLAVDTLANLEERRGRDEH